MRSIFMGCVLASLLGGNLAMSPVAQAAGVHLNNYEKLMQKCDGCRNINESIQYLLNIIIDNIKNKRDFYNLPNGNNDVPAYNDAIDILDILKDYWPEFKNDINNLINGIGIEPLNIFKQLNCLSYFYRSSRDEDWRKSFNQMSESNHASDMNIEIKKSVAKLVKRMVETDRYQTSELNRALDREEDSEEKKKVDLVGLKVEDDELPNFLKLSYYELGEYIRGLSRKYIKKTGIHLALALLWEAEVAQEIYGRKGEKSLDEKDINRIFFVRNLFTAIAWTKYNGRAFMKSLVSDNRRMMRWTGFGEEAVEQVQGFRNRFIKELFEVFLNINPKDRRIVELIKKDKVADFVTYTNMYPLNNKKFGKNLGEHFPYLSRHPNFRNASTALDLSIFYDAWQIYRYILGNFGSLDISRWYAITDSDEMIADFEEHYLYPNRQNDDPTAIISDDFISCAVQFEHFDIVDYLLSTYRNGMDQYDFFAKHGFTTLAAEH